MKPAPFDYVAPRTLEAAVAALAAHGPEAKVLAGGQSLLPLLKFRLARPTLLVDLGRIQGLAYVRAENGTLHIGAMARHAEVQASPLVRERLPLLGEATGLIGHAPIRHRGTLGGSLAHADPAAELPVAALALEAELRAVGPAGARSIPAEQFFTALMATALAPAEVLTEVRWPVPPAGTGSAFLELARRTGDFALVSVAALLTPGPGGTIARARVALGAVGPVPVRARAVEATLEGAVASPELFAAAAEQAGQGLDPPSDLHASAAYRLAVLPVYVARALEAAWGRAGE